MADCSHSLFGSHRERSLMWTFGRLKTVRCEVRTNRDAIMDLSGPISVKKSPDKDVSLLGLSD
jgi:hypothetical protein